MMISLYRAVRRGSFDYLFIREWRGRQLTARLTSYREGRITGVGRDTNLGRIGEPSTDRAVCKVVRRALVGGHRVLYAYVLSEAFPLSHNCLKRLAGVEVTPDLTDGVPIWDSSRRARGAKPSYLLFTVLSSLAK